MSGLQETKKSARNGGVSTRENQGFSAEERAAMKERAKELKAEERQAKNREAGEKDVFEKIAEMPESERRLAERIHEIVKANAPQLMPRTWYGMPAYTRDGKVVCFFQAASKFESRYATFGFTDSANLDDGALWPTSYAVSEITPEVEKMLADLVRKAVS